MIVVDTSTNLNMYLASTSTSVVATAYFVDTNNVPAQQITPAGGTASTPVVIVTHNGTYQRLVQHIEIYNGDASTQTVTVLMGTQILLTTSLSSGATLQYTTNGGWVVPTTTSSYFPSGGW